MLLLTHYNNIDCLDLHRKSLSGYTPMTAVRDFLRSYVASFMTLQFHAVTGCDVAGKLAVRAKIFGQENSLRKEITKILSIRCLSYKIVKSKMWFKCLLDSFVGPTVLRQHQRESRLVW